MGSSFYDVIVVGAGSAGLTAAIGLARGGFRVAVLEAASYPGAENWSGCVYFCENLVDPDILGPEGVEALAWERRLVERGTYATDGHSLLGMTYRDPQAFRHCYTVLRPIFDHHIAQAALKLGVAILNETTVESLIREGGRVVGVSTRRGPLYADLTFLAEGDASHLVTREGYERFTDPREAPKFLQGIKQVIELPPGVIEETFKVGPEEGIAVEMLLRNGTLRGKPVRLNMGGFLYTNRQSLSVGLVLPADNLKENFGGDPNLLMEWFENLPSLQPWFKHGTRGTFGAKIIRGGGAKDVPRLIDHGLAIGGAASAIGIDFPYPNFTGPASSMGLLLARAARRIRDEKTGFTQEALKKHYLDPLQKTHYWKDVEFLRRWPGYVKRTQVFFGRNIDLSLGSAYVWTRPAWLTRKWFNWLRLGWAVAGPSQWGELRGDMRHLSRALRFDEIMGRPGMGRLLLDGSVNALRDLFGSPRPHLPEAGDIRLHYRVAGEETAGSSPALLRRWFRRFTPVLGSAARRVYTNDDEPMAHKLYAATRLLIRQVNMLDLVGAGLVGLAAGVSGVALLGWDRMIARLRGARSPADQGSYPRYAAAALRATDMTPSLAPAAAGWEGRLARLAYQTVKASHIHVLWPRMLADKNAVVKHGLWHVCPAHVYEARVSPQQQLHVVVNFENCIKCETCWRTGDLVDWGRDGQHRFIYRVHSPVTQRLLDSARQAATARPALPFATDWWEAAARDLGERLRAERPQPGNGQHAAEIAELQSLLTKLERKLEAFDEALAEEPRTIDRPRAEYLEMLARYAQQLAIRVVEVLRGSVLASSPQGSLALAHGQLLTLALTLATKAEERARRTWDQKYSWAAADGRQLRQHHVTGMRRLLLTLEKHVTGRVVAPEPSLAWLQCEEDERTTANQRAEMVAALDDVIPRSIWRDLEAGRPLTTAQDNLARRLLSQVPPLDPNHLGKTLHPPARKALLAELGRRDPSLAYRVACHLWARDLARLASGSSALSKAFQRWARGDEWACFASVDATPAGNGWSGEALFVPALGAKSLLLLVGDQMAALPLDTPGLHIEALPTLGLRGAGLARIRLDNLVLPDDRANVDHDRILRAWKVLSAADLTSIAGGMADILTERAISHATSRVQFPGLFHDEQARDAIGKFGAVKKMVAEMAARRFLIETFDHTLSPTDFSSPSAVTAGLVKMVVAEALGTQPGSLSYNAGQVFGGTGYSEDDILAKFYRDAAAWRYLGPVDIETRQQHGDELLRHWRPDGQRLASLRGEAELFDPLAQRKALQAELDEVRVVRSRLRGLVNEWLAAGDGAAEGRATLTTRAHAEVGEGLARQDAHLLATKALLLRTHARLEQGLPAETEIALTRVWLEGAAVSLEEFESGLRRHFVLADWHDDRPVVEPSDGPAVGSYAAYLAAPAPYDSGDFLEKPIDLAQPRFVPELFTADPELAARNREFRELIGGYFGTPRADGISYERHIERAHRMADADLDFCRRHGFFRVMIPQDLGGAGRPKIDYYLLITNAQKLADIAVSLTIQVNTSIGTTPVLLARGKDLPKAQKELGPFVGDTSLQEEVRKGVAALIATLERGDGRRAEAAYRDLHKRLEASVLGSAALKTLAHRFVDAWGEAGRVGKTFDLPAMQKRLEEARAAWQDACGRAEDLHRELARRREACDLFLKWVASGQISAFALTEPSAGSDTARVATRAVLRSVPVLQESEGVLHFVPAGAKERRNLLDARRLEFRWDETEGGKEYRAYYRYKDGVEPALLHFDEYDYETDDPAERLWYDHGGHRVHFVDIGQLRERDGQSWYDYWELTGAKMWITNGRMCGIMCLYAKTDEGITGFIVDRHAEGLIVGKDEAKLGQCGSPTNELSLQAVRVPRENVIGLEGRGQVNALETLNVGRAGLPVSAVAQMEGLIESSRAFAQAAHGEILDGAAWRLARMEEERFTAEAVAFEVIGRFEHPRAKSVSMESAISKMLVTEALHRVIELAEDIHGIAGQTQLHLVEKRKRDARVLNIYEGTNEVQRFFLLKSLASLAGARKAGDDKKSAHASREALEVETLRGQARQRLTAAVGLFGQELWQNPNLQANCFLLSEAVAWLKAADSTLGRLAWLSRQEMANDGQAVSPWMAGIDLGRRALARCASETRDRLRRFDEELTTLRRGYYAPEVRAANLLFEPAATPSIPRPTSSVDRPLFILVVVEPSAAEVPQPRVQDGKLWEPHWTLSEADRAALETALRLRDDAEATVSIQVAAVAPRAAASALREVLSLGADRVRLLVPETDAVAADGAAAALALVLRSGQRFDLILTGAGAASAEEGTVGRLTAAALDVPFVGTAAALAVRVNNHESNAWLVGGDSRRRLRALPAAVGIEAGLPLRDFTTDGYLGHLSKVVEVERWPKKIPTRPVRYAARAGADAAPGDEPTAALSADEAALRVLDELGLRGGAAVPVHPLEGDFEAVPGLRTLAGRAAAVIAAESDGRLQTTAGPTLRAARFLADLEGIEVGAVLVVPPEEEAQRRAAAQARASFRGDVVLLVLGDAEADPEARGRALQACWPSDETPRILVGEPWTETAFAALAGRSPAGTRVVQRIRRLAFEGDKLLLETNQARGKLTARQYLDADADAATFLTLTAEAEMMDNRSTALSRLKPFHPGALHEGQLRRWTPSLDRFYSQADIRRLLEEVKAATGLVRLSDAAFILDVGFGVGNRDGYETVIEPLEKALRDLGARDLVIGGSRKVTEELHLLPADRQIGQSGVSVSPRLLLAIGVSGAPQHLAYIGSGATILAFNRDPEAPIMTLNQRQPRPRVFPVVGDLFETVPALIRALRADKDADGQESSRSPAEVSS